MSTTTTNYGLIKPDTTDPILIGQLNDNADIIDATLKSLSDVLDVAKLGIKYKGEVNYYSNLPASGNEIGDAYTVKYAGSSGTTPDGTEYVWGTVSDTNQWIDFSKDSYSKAEVDALLSLKANIADIPTPSTAAPAMDGTAAAGTSTNYARADHVHPSDTSKQDALTTAQLAAANSGINSAKVEQIETNKNNILTVADQSTKYNICDYTRVNTSQYPDSSTGATISFDPDTLEYNINGTTNSTGTLLSNIYFDTSTTKAIPNGEWVAQIFPTLENLQLQIVTNNIFSNGNRPITFTVTDDDTRSWARLYLAKNKTFNNAKIKLMIIPKSLWNAGFTDYQPYAMSNAELTAAIQALQAQLANQ